MKSLMLVLLTTMLWVRYPTLDGKQCDGCSGIVMGSQIDDKGRVCYVVLEDASGELVLVPHLEAYDKKWIDVKARHRIGGNR